MASAISDPEQVLIGPSPEESRDGPPENEENQPIEDWTTETNEALET